ncbi:MAG TPA: hypothetical protein VFZ66_29760 [Herpetosiphonaceae bacterium]
MGRPASDNGTTRKRYLELILDGLRSLNTSYTPIQTDLRTLRDTLDALQAALLQNKHHEASAHSIAAKHHARQVHDHLIDQLAQLERELGGIAQLAQEGINPPEANSRSRAFFGNDERPGAEPSRSSPSPTLGKE